MKHLAIAAIFGWLVAGAVATPARADDAQARGTWPERWPWYHNGLDVPAAPGQPVVSPIDGTVFAIGAVDVPTAGLPAPAVVHIIGHQRHAGLAFRIFYIQVDALAPGDTVVGGQSVLGVIADVRRRWPGAPSAQLHVEVFRGSERIDPSEVIAPAGPPDDGKPR